MGIQNYGPDHHLAMRLSKLERDVLALSTRDVLQNASIGVNGLTVTGTGGINVTGGGNITISGTGVLNLTGGGLTTVASLTASGSITASGPLSGSSLQANGGAISGGAISGASVGVTGDSYAGGNGTIQSALTVNGQIYIPNAFPASTGYVNAYINGDGRISSGASAARFKQDFAPVDADPLIAGIYAADLLHFRLIAAVEEIDHKMGPLVEGESRGTAEIEIGLLADQLQTIGLDEFVYRNSAGDVLGIHYERLAVPLIAVVQSLDRRLRASGL